MENPVINTWRQGTRLVESSSRMIDQHFPDQRFKALMGWEGIMIWDREVDPVNLLDAFMKRAAAESCGQCAPCRLGTAQLVRIMEAVCGGHGCEQDLERMCFLARQIALTARCDIGRTLFLIKTG